ncbi:MAG: DUF2461 domain-containing protein [Bacteroidota bacterium]
MAFFDADYHAFFSELTEFNYKEWFDDHRKRYEKSVKAPFKRFVDLLIERVRDEVDPSVLITSKEAIFRINRDIRFSKDKTPYKTQMSAIISPGGKKDKTDPGLYIEFGPQSTAVYTGFYMGSTKQVYAIREAIARDLNHFQSIIKDKGFVAHFPEGIQGEKAKRIPKEFQEAAASEPLIYNKQFFCNSHYPAGKILETDLLDFLVAHYQAAKPLVDFIRPVVKLQEA